MSENRKLAAILAADVVGFSRLAGTDEDRTLARLRALRSDLIDPTISVHNGRIINRTGDGALVEFRSVVDAVRCAIEVQSAMVERNAGVPEDRRIEFRIGIHLGDVVEEIDADLMGGGVNIAARLEGICDPGGVCLSEDAWRQVRDKVRVAFADLGEKALKNIARPVRVYAVKAEPTAAKYPAPAPDKPGPPRLSIVVLPFANLSGEPEQEYFVDGVTESLTTDLSRMRGMLVIGRNTAFTFKGKAVDLKQIGRDLNVRYVLEGSVQRGGNRLRVNVQLVETETGNHLWAERFDKPVVDLFDMQDEIVARLANMLNAELYAAEAQRGARAPNPDAMDLFFQGISYFNKGPTPEHLGQARGFAERALELDLDNIAALNLRAVTDVTAAMMYQTDDRAARISAAEAALAKALSLAPEFAPAHYSLGLCYMSTNRAGAALSAFERALALDRNLAGAHSFMGLSKLLTGRGEETEAHVHEALRLSPRDRFAFAFIGHLALAKLHLGSDDEAVAWYRRSIELNRNNPLTHFYLAAALALIGRLEEARVESQLVLSLDPNFSVRRFREGAYSDNPVFLKQRERIIEGMRKAGLPEG